MKKVITTIIMLLLPLSMYGWGTNDIDADGLPDDWETYWFGGLDESATNDYDGDGLSNSNECYWIYESDPTDPTDCDGDNLNDWVEYNFGTNPWTNDTDNDLIYDNFERDCGFDGNDADMDDDGLIDGIEYFYCDSSPTNANTDNDCMDDYEEYIAGTIPTNPLSFFSITNSVRTDNKLSLDWYWATNRTYRIEGSTSLISTNWYEIGFY